MPYDKEAVDRAIGTSRQKIGGRESKLIHSLLKGRTEPVSDETSKWMEERRQLRSQQKGYKNLAHKESSRGKE